MLYLFILFFLNRKIYRIWNSHAFKMNAIFFKPMNRKYIHKSAIYVSSTFVSYIWLENCINVMKHDLFHGTTYASIYVSLFDAHNILKQEKVLYSLEWNVRLDYYIFCQHGMQILVPDSSIIGRRWMASTNMLLYCILKCKIDYKWSEFPNSILELYLLLHYVINSCLIVTGEVFTL